MAEAKWSAEGTVVAGLIERKGFTRIEIASRLRVSPDVVDNLCSGRTKLKGQRLKEMAFALDMPEGQLRSMLMASTPYSAEAPRLATINEPRATYQHDKTVTIRGGKIIIVPNGKRAIPIYGSVTAGQPGRTFSDAEDVEFMTDWPSPFERWGRNVTGSSMEPEFRERDIAVFENRRAEKNQAVYAVRDGEDTFKILREGKTGEGMLWPLNLDGHEPFSAEGWQILGVLTARIRYGAGGLRDQRDYPLNFTFRPGWKSDD